MTDQWSGIHPQKPIEHPAPCPGPVGCECDETTMDGERGSLARLRSSAEQGFCVHGYRRCCQNKAKESKGYLPESGVWTAEEREDDEMHTRYGIRHIPEGSDLTPRQYANLQVQKAANTVAALVAALEASLRRERAMNPDDSLQGDEERDFLDERREADRLLYAVKR